MSDSSPSIKMMRRGALLLLASLVVIFVFISISSFAGRDRPDPYTVKPLGTDAVEGKRVFQAYNCMDCHTVVGNGAYFAPDLTYVYQDDGPAWTMAFLSQLKVWPTKPMVDSQIDSLKAEGLLDVASREAYYEKWPTAVGDATDRGDWQILMPDLHLTPQEQIALTAWLSYISEVNTAGWPPEANPDPAVAAGIQNRLHAKFGGPPVPVPSPTPDAP